MENNNRKKHQAVLWTVIAVTFTVVGALVMPAIPQDPLYHDFADTRSFLGIPNMLDVLSNIPLALIGLFGMVFCLRNDEPEPESNRLKILLFATILLTGIGSSVYHWRPDNVSLVMDRLPLSVMLMVVYLVVLADRISPRIAARLVWPVLAAGPASVLYWYWSELQGAGDLRFYGVVQLLPLLLIPATILPLPKGTIRNTTIWKAFAWYGVAKIAEYMDKPIFEWTGFVSGHTLKHLCAGIAAYCLLAIIKPLNVRR